MKTKNRQKSLIKKLFILLFRMKKTVFIAVAGLMMTACSNDKSDVTIKVPEGYAEKTLVVSHVTIDNIFNAKQQDDLHIVYDTLDVVDGVAKLRLDPAGAARYNIESPVVSMIEPDFYASPSDHLEIVIKSFEPLDYSVTGSQLMEDIMTYTSMTRPIQEEYMALFNAVDTESEEPSQDLEQKSKDFRDRYDAAVKQFVADNPKSQAVPLVITELSADDFKVLYDNMTPEAKSSMLMPYAELYNRQTEEMFQERNAEEARKAEVASGKITAPNFTLPNLEGKMVSLSDFRGKWVVLDFWGSWCGWCVKGFPALKDAYKKYGDKIVVIGIGCNEPEADWRGGVERHQLPWINVYNGNDKALYEAYNITGFPTKAIINPEGKLVDLTTGEDPSFFDRLAGFVGK